MSYKKISRIALLCFFLLSCKPHYTVNNTILCAEALLNTAPDSAFRLLISISDPGKLSKADYAAWCMHYTHVQYKLYRDIKSDSIIRIAVNYYDNSDMPKYSGTAYYLWGCVLRINQHNIEAIEAFKHADDVLKTTNEHDLKGLINFNLGVIYIQEELYFQALDNFKKSLACFKCSNDKRYQAYAYRAISNVYLQLNYPFDTIEYYTGLAIRLSKETGDSTNYYNNLAYLGELLYNRNYIRSKDLLLQGYRHLSSKKAELATFLSIIYSSLNRLDSANYYLRVSLADTIVNDKSKVLKLLARAYLSKEKENHKQASEYFEKAYLKRDSVFQQSIRSQLYRIDKQYDLSKKEKENATLKIANRNNAIWMALLIIAVLSTLIILLLINIRYKKKQIINEMEKHRLELEIKTKQIENDQKRELLLSKLQSKIENSVRFNRLNNGLLQQNKQEAFIEEITKQSVISEKEMQYYIDEANKLFDGRITKLAEANPLLTLNDLIVITLICLQVDIFDSCTLLNISQNTMYMRRKRIKKHLGLADNASMEKWVKQNVGQLDVNKQKRDFNI